AIVTADTQVNDWIAALPVGLHDEADTVPPAELGGEAERLEQVERDIEPIGFLGIDVEADIVALGPHGQCLEPRQQLGHDALELAASVARMQRRELDRDAR